LTFTNTGKNRIRDLVNTDLNHGQLGTSVTGAQATDTSLVSGATDTSLSLSTQTADKQIVADYSLPATAAQGSTFGEFGVFNSNNVMFARFVFATLTHASTDEWQFSTRLWIN
jgi:hypothetical protein